MFSKTFQYGLRAAVLLANEPNNAFVKVRDLSETLGLPQSVLAKTLHVLGSAGIIETLRGPHGGCRWNPESDLLTLADLARLLDGRLEREGCFLGLADCDEGRCLLPGFTPGALFWAMDRVTLREVAKRGAMDRVTLREVAKRGAQITTNDSETIK